MAEKKNAFLEGHKSGLESGFWSEMYRSNLIHTMEMSFSTAVLKEWGISDIIVNSDKILVKWYKRFRPLDKEELKKKYGRSR